MVEKISYKRLVYESVDDKSLTKVASQKFDGKKVSGSNGLSIFIKVSQF